MAIGGSCHGLLVILLVHVTASSARLTDRSTAAASPIRLFACPAAAEYQPRPSLLRLYMFGHCAANGESLQ
ncbi:hypothetical protein V8C35DRAFT_167534 [Trichoderma chlorosporum]